MLHLVAHALVPLVVARLLVGQCWVRVWLLLLATMAVDVDHLLATPVYDPQRCSIDFHPLHTRPAIVAYALLLLLPPLARRLSTREPPQRRAAVLGWIGLGLLIHMGLDGIECWRWG